MSLRLPIGVSDFKKIIEQDYYFIDKTHFIRDIMDYVAEVALITRPRRFGKTINLSMLYYFLEGFIEEGTEHLFDNFAIKKDKAFCDKYHRKFPVIFISLKDLKKDDFDDALLGLKSLVKQLYEKFKPFLFDSLTNEQQETYIQIIRKQSDSEDLTDAIRVLSQYLHKKTGQKPFILIDEYDTPITSAYSHDYYDKIMGTMSNLFGKVLKDNNDLYKGVLTGITRIAKESIFSGVNNFVVHGVLSNKFSEYFGFTENEVHQLVSLSTNSLALDEIKRWYNGYQFGGRVMYNPWSILNCIDNQGRLQPYWVNTSDNILIKQLIEIASPDIKHTFTQLIQRKSIEKIVDESLVFPELNRREFAIWGLLLSSGYLQAKSHQNNEGYLHCSLAIPNQEAAFIYKDIISSWFNDALTPYKYSTFLESLAQGKVEQFSNLLNEYLRQSGSVFDFNQRGSEQVFHTFILGLVSGLRADYVIESNREAGLGRFDVILIPKNKSAMGHILEFKVADSEKALKFKAVEGLQQIRDKDYLATMRQHGVLSVQLLGLAFYNKQALVLSEVEDNL